MATSSLPDWMINHNPPYTYTIGGSYQPVINVVCNECHVFWTTGLGGEPAISQDEAIVSAHANGWYLGRSIRVCAECREKIKPQ